MEPVSNAPTRSTKVCCDEVPRIGTCQGEPDQSLADYESYQFVCLRNTNAITPSARMAREDRTLGLLCLIYGGVISLLVLIPNTVPGRIGMVFCAGFMLGTGLVLRWNGRRLGSRSDAPPPPKQTARAKVAAEK